MTRAPAMHDRRCGIDHRPGKAGQKTQRAGKIRNQQRCLLPPGKHGFDGEFGKHLHPGENSESKALSDKELGRLRAPRYEQRGEKDGRNGPKRRPRTRFGERYREK